MWKATRALCIYCSLQTLVAIQPRLTVLASNIPANQTDYLWQTVWASYWGWQNCLFSAIASSESPSLLPSYNTGGDISNTASIKTILWPLFYKPLPKFNQFGGTIPCQLFSPYHLTGQLLNYFKEQNQWREGEMFCPCQGLQTSKGQPPWLFKAASLTSDHGSGNQGCSSSTQFPHSSMHKLWVVFMSSLWEGEISVMCAPQGWYKSATDMPSQMQSQVVLFQFYTRADLLYKGSMSNGCPTTSTRKLVSPLPSLVSCWVH